MAVRRESLEISRRYAQAQAAIASDAAKRVRIVWLRVARGVRIGDAGNVFGSLAPLILASAQAAAVRNSDAYLAAFFASELGEEFDPLGLDPSLFSGVEGTDATPAAAYAAAVKRATSMSRDLGFDIDGAMKNGARAAARLTTTEVRRAGRASVSWVIDGRQIRGPLRVRAYQRMTTSPNPCTACLSGAGATFATSEAFRYHPGCSCVAVPVLDVPGADRHGPPTGRELFDNLPAEAQDRRYGPEAAAALRSGVPLDAFAGTDKAGYLTTAPNRKAIPHAR